MATEIDLIVDSYTGDLSNWDNREGSSPYLDVIDNWIHEAKSSAATEGYFGFENLEPGVSIVSVTLHVECKGDDVNDQIIIHVSDGGAFTNEGTITVDQNDYDYETLDLAAKLNTEAQVNAAQIYLEYLGIRGGDDVYARRAFLRVVYTISGQAYERFAPAAFVSTAITDRALTLMRRRPVALSSTGIPDRTLTLTRKESATLSSVGVATRALGFIRSVSATFSLVGVVTRTRALIRKGSASISSSGITKRTLKLMRTGSAAFSLAGIARGIRFETQAFIRTASAALSTVGITHRHLAVRRQGSPSTGEKKAQ